MGLSQLEGGMAGQQYCVTGARHTYFQSLEEGNPRSSRSASEVAAVVRELPLIALSVLSLGIWAPILAAITALAVALVLARLL
jgi:hypothetical protein